MPDHPSDRPKIIVDEDWKSQVQAEKQRLEAEVQPPPPAGEEMEMPPASFPVLLSTLASQALVCLGQIPNPATGKPEIFLDDAKHFIDTLQMLEEKTRGNLTGEEGEMLTGLLHELRMVYVAVSQQSPPGAAGGEIK